MTPDRRAALRSFFWRSGLQKTGATMRITLLIVFGAAGTLARLHITVAPFIIGSGLAGISLPAIRLLNEASRPQAKIYQLGADVLFDLAFT